MNGFYITISNGLLESGHRKRIGPAVWEFLWCIDKITRIDENGIGYVLGGKPVKLEEIAQEGVCRDTVSRNLNRLEKEGYISMVHTPYGIKIMVQKAKKRFGKNVEPKADRLDKNVEPKRIDKSVEPLRKNVEPNKTIQLDKDSLDSKASAPKGADADRDHVLIVEVIDSFEPVNPHFGRWYANKTQRGSIKRLLALHGLEKIKKVLALLPETNKRPFFPTITTPTQLEDKWSALEAQCLKKKQELLEKKPNVIFS